MLKKNKGRLILSSVLTLMPMLFGLLFWNRLPEQFTTHWGADGQADGWSGRGFFLWMPLILLAVHWLCLWFTAKDPKNADQHPKAFRLVVWIIPALSLTCAGFTWCIAMGYTFSALRLMSVMTGLLFTVLGNFMPKFRRNSTLGIKIKWTLESEENWNATHRFGGKLWTATGLVILCGIFLPEKWAMPLLLLALIPAAVVPVLYSWLYYKKHPEAEADPDPRENSPSRKWAMIITAVMTAALAVFLVVILTTGNIHFRQEAAGLTIEASFWEDLVLPYDQIDSIELREEGVEGVRSSGFGSPRLLMGTFQNDEFGFYTRYTYTGGGPAIVISSGNRILVIAAKEPEETRAIYASLAERIH